MSAVQGCLRKMPATLTADGMVHYRLRLDESELPLNDCLGQQLTLEFSGAIFCVHCGRATRKSFDQGHCYPCFQKLAACDRCIVSPELCHFDQGSCREPDWAQGFCMTDHVVYLANSSGLKVGITRGNQLPTRWIDQGAVAAAPLVRVQSRQQAGLLEAQLKACVADKTNWRQMLKGEPTPVDFQATFGQLHEQAAPILAQLQDRFGLQALSPVLQPQVTDIRYPVQRYPDKVVSHNVEKTPLISGRLQGIKGQYLILDTGVINLRKYSGYQVAFSVQDNS